jgi:molybdopterin synthase catalytic subunit
MLRFSGKSEGMDATIRIQAGPFDSGEELARLPASAGAVASFIGRVRPEPGLTALCLEHYPGMTEAEIARQIDDAAARWPLLAVTVIHRVGELKPGDDIVLIAVAAQHRFEAFAACESLMDQLKTKAPFWKEERLTNATHWVAAKASDDAAAARWEKP